MSRLKSTWLSGLVVAGAMAWGLGAAAADPIRIGIANFGEHPQLNASIAGFKKALTANGFVEGKDVVYTESHTNFDASLVPQMIAKLQAEQPKLVYTITTPVSQIAKKALAGSGIPIVFAAVTDPVAAKLVKGWEASGTNVTGVSDLSPLDKHLALIKRVVPNAKRVGVIYSPGEANSVSIVDALKKAMPAAGLMLVEGAAARTVDVASAAQSLVGKVDVIYAPTDNNVMSAFEGIVKVAQQARIPVVAADTDAVKRGAVAALGLNYYDIGHQTGKIVVRILQGQAPGTIASQTSENFELHVNPGAAQKQGVTLSDELVKSAQVVVK